MRIGFNALCAENRSGTGRYAGRLVAALSKHDPENKYVVLLSDKSPLISELRDTPNVELCPTRTSGVLSRFLFEKVGLPKWIRRSRLDLYHGPAFILPTNCPVPGVVTIHDLVFHLFPETTPITRRSHYKRAIPRSIRQATMILADSRSTAHDLHKHFGVPTGKIEVAYLGVEDYFYNKLGPDRLEDIRQRLRLPRSYFLSVGTLEPRKNLPGLLRSYAMLRHSDAEIPDLVVVGRQGWGADQIGEMARELGLEGVVHFPGFVEDSDLPGLYQLARLFVCVSLYEGFGLPVLEAMASGTPVVASNNSSIPEVAGDTALLVDGKEPRLVARAMAETLADPEATALRVAKGIRRARNFTWKAAAEEALIGYRKACRQ
jgi:glycosyltransferase involved in cell wall biosynthesis